MSEYVIWWYLTFFNTWSRQHRFCCFTELFLGRCLLFERCSKASHLFWSLTKDFFSWLCLLCSETMLVSKSLAKLVQALVQNIFSSHFPSSFCSRIQMTIHETLFCQFISLRFATQANIILKGSSNEYLAGEKAGSLAPYVS